MIRARALTILALLPLAACGEANMADQPRAKNWDKNSFFPQALTMREPAAGSVPRDDPARASPQPAVITEGLLARGQERYGIFCTPCHGDSGSGGGMIVARGFPPPGSLAADRLRTATGPELYQTISQGHGAMYGMAQMIPSRDRWAIVAYVRALQLSQNAEVARLPAEDRTRLEASQ